YQRQSETAARQQILYDSMLHTYNRVDVVGASARARMDLGRGGSLSFGVEGSFEWVDSEASRSVLHEGADAQTTPSAAEVRYPDGSRAQTVTLFLQDDIDLERLILGQPGERPGRLRLLLGARGGANLLHIGQDDRLQQLLGGLMSSAIGDRQY